MSLEESLQEHEEKVDALLKLANKYLSAINAWKKATVIGNINDIQRKSALAEQLVLDLPQATSDTKSDWVFDIKTYLVGDAWREELKETAFNMFGLHTLTDDDALISSPITIRSQPARSQFLFGRVNWPALRPKAAAAELMRLREKTGSSNSQAFVESLHNASIRLSDKTDPHAKFRDIYDLFCYAPKYKKENPPAAFGQQIYALHCSDIRTTRAGSIFQIEYPTGNYKEKDVFTVQSEDGRPIRYFNIWFKKA